ncbi:YciI family protein [Bacillus cereus group sp. BfR-BA-01380]|uniref:YciI family protein n=1 Tax=Bacillus cereus group sp. BfR-BA-01380 TaxID=2920324 RepID=UPI001F5AA269|nr:YciI family protein [Bacillus cereus group sp. BfR-BA-01380]
MNYFVILFTQGENWEQGKHIWEQDLEEHKVYWAQHRTEKVVAGGPFIDDTGGMIILEVESLEEAKELASCDPAVSNNIFHANVHPWHPISKKF